MEILHELTDAVENGKKLHLGTARSWVTFCLKGGEYSAFGDESTKAEPAWLQVVSKFSGEKPLHISLEPVKGKPDHYKLTFRGNLTNHSKFDEYYRMFQDGGELQIKVNSRTHNEAKPLTIKSSKLHRTYTYTDNDESCSLHMC